MTLLDAEPFLPVPEGLSRALELEPQAATPLPWTGWAFHSSDAEPTGLEFPFATVLDRSEGTVTLRLESPRAAATMHLFINEQADLRQITLPDGQLIDYSDFGPAPYRQFSCRGLSCSGLELELTLGNPAALELLVVDETPGLPPAAEQLTAARGELAVAWQDGDVTMAVNHQVPGR